MRLVDLTERRRLSSRSRIVFSGPEVELVELLNVFAADYQFVEDPSLPTGKHSYDFVAKNAPQLSPAVEITVTPNEGVAWHGRFFGNYDGPSFVVNGPSARALVTVASGVAYVVPVDSPSDFRVVPIWPVRCVRCDPSLGLVMLVSFTDVVALGEAGEPVWEQKNLASEGFTVVRLEGSTLVVSGFVAEKDREVKTTLDLASGEVLTKV